MTICEKIKVPARSFHQGYNYSDEEVGQFSSIINVDSLAVALSATSRPICPGAMSSSLAITSKTRQ